MENVILHLSVMQSLDYILCLLSSLHIFFPSSLFFPCLLYSLLIFYSHLTSFSSTLPCRINSTQNVFIEGVLKRWQDLILLSPIVQIGNRNKQWPAQDHTVHLGQSPPTLVTFPSLTSSFVSSEGAEGYWSGPNSSLLSSFSFQWSNKRTSGFFRSFLRVVIKLHELEGVKIFWKHKVYYKNKKLQWRWF